MIFFITAGVWLVLILAGIGVHAVYAAVDPVRVLAIIAAIGIAYHLVVALIDRYVWPRK